MSPRRYPLYGWQIVSVVIVAIYVILGLLTVVRPSSKSLYNQAMAEVDTIEAHIHAQATTIARQAMTITLQAETIADAEIRRLDQEDLDRDRYLNAMDPDTDGDGRCNVAESMDAANPGRDDPSCSGEDLDDDGDGVPDVVDSERTNPTVR